MSLASDTCERLVTLVLVPRGGVDEESHADFCSAICDVAILFAALTAVARLGYTSKWMCGQRPA